MLDLIIVGGGPAGVAAAVYAARKQLKTVLVVQEWGGQSNVSSDIHNWIGTPSISGADLAKALRAHAEVHAGEFLTIKSSVRAVGLTAGTDKVVVALSNKEVLDAKTLLIATGSNRRKLEISGAAQYDQKGLTYCASCDGPLFAGQDVVVIGGGNAGFESALQLLAYCKKVYLLNRTEAFRADEVTVAAARAHANMEIIVNAEPTAVQGVQFVNALKYRDIGTGIEKKLDVTGIFVEIGLLPNTDWLGTTVMLNPTKQVVVDPRTQRAYLPARESDSRGHESQTLVLHPRIWAAGDVTDGLYHQNNIAAGDAVKALEDIYVAIKGNKL